MLTLATVVVSGAVVFVQGNVGTPRGASNQPGRGGAGGVFAPITDVPYGDYTGYTKLWDGRTLTNWDGESDVWSIDNAAIHADTIKTPGQHHLHYKGPNAVMKDFDLKVEFKISAMGANGGIQYRSRLLMAPHKGSIQNPLGSAMAPNIGTFAAAVQAGLAERAPARQGGGGGQGAPTTNSTPADPTAGYQNPWQVSGYQFDLDSNNRFTGQLYEGQGRGIVNPPGGLVELVPGAQNRIGTVNPNPAGAVKPHNGLQGEWQQVQIIARGNTLVHVLNGQVITVSIDDDPVSRALQGILSLQLEGSGQIWYRNVYVRHLN
jgi:Domain of Unknown Function (DUF1080)